MGAYHKTSDVTADPDFADRADLYVDPERKCEFFNEELTGGFRGLCFAVVLRALEDGVCERWLRGICRAYEVTLPERFLAQRPVKRLRMNHYTSRLTYSPRNKIMLSWLDGGLVTKNELMRVA